MELLANAFVFYIVSYFLVAVIRGNQRYMKHRVHYQAIKLKTIDAYMRCFFKRVGKPLTFVFAGILAGCEVLIFYYW